MRWRRIAVIAGILVAAAGIGAVSWGLFAYNQITKIDRSDPQVVTYKYLLAALVDKDQPGVDLYACTDQSGLAPIRALRAELDQRERDFGVTVIVSWGAFSGSGESQTTVLEISGQQNGNVTSTREETWRFTLENDGGWRVCKAEKLESQPSPTPTTAR
jgi:hypothetical protein